MNSAISTLRAIQITIQIQIKNSGSRSDEGLGVRILGSHFFRKIHIRGVLTFWPWCYFLTLVSGLSAFFGRSYPSACIRHPPLVSSDLRTYADQFRARVPSNHAAPLPPFIPILRHNCFEMVVMGKNISRATNYGNFPHEGDLFILCIYIVKEVFCLAISYWVSQHPPPPLLMFVENTQ